MQQLYIYIHIGMLGYFIPRYLDICIEWHCCRAVIDGLMKGLCLLVFAFLQRYPCIEETRTVRDDRLVLFGLPSLVMISTMYWITAYLCQRPRYLVKFLIITLESHNIVL